MVCAFYCLNNLNNTSALPWLLATACLLDKSFLFVMMKWRTKTGVFLVLLTLYLILYKAGQVVPKGSPHQSFSSRDTNADSSDTAAAKQTLIVKDPTTTDHPISKVHHLAQLSSPDKKGECGINLRHGYILTLQFSGQQAAALRALVSQLCWVGSFCLPMYVVEPFIHNNQVGCISNSGGLRSSEYFDLHKFNEASTREGYAELVTWEDFVKNAPRHTILLKMIGVNATGSRPPTKVVQAASKTKKTCYKAPSPANFQCLFEQMQDFCITEVITAPFGFGSDNIFTAEEMYNVIFKKWKPEEVTLIVTFWNEPWYVPNPKLEDSHFCRHSGEKGIRNRFYPSLQLLKHAEKYEDLFLKPRNSLAVMMRMEHIVLQLVKKRKAWSLEACLRNLTDTVKSIQKRFSTSKAFVTADIGSFKSSSWEKFLPSYVASRNGSQLIKTVKRTVCALSNHKWTFDEWEKSFVQATGGIDYPSYIAALQRTVASRADCLVLFGGGKFQKLALHSYIQSHPDRSQWCIHLVCTNNEYGFNDIINHKEH